MVNEFLNRNSRPRFVRSLIRQHQLLSRAVGSLPIKIRLPAAQRGQPNL